MAAGCDGEHTRFPFLATVRSLVATVVTVLGVAVVVMVLLVVHRPVEMALSSDGYVQADDWWQIENKIAGPASKVDIYLGLVADNPSGRGEINGSINLIRVIDIENMVEFCKFEPKTSDDKAASSFDLPPHSSRRYSRWVSISEKAQLNFLYDSHFKDKSGFSVLLVVETAYRTAGHSPKNMSYYCSPVTFQQGIQDSEDDYSEEGGDVTCKTAKEMGYNTPNFTSKYSAVPK